MHGTVMRCILPLAVFTEQLFNTLRLDKAILIQAPENILSNPEIKQHIFTYI